MWLDSFYTCPLGGDSAFWMISWSGTLGVVSAGWLHFYLRYLESARISRWCFGNVRSVGFINYKEFVNTLTTYSREFFWVILMIWPKQNWCKCWQEMKIFSRLRWVKNENFMCWMKLRKIFRNFLKNSVKSKIDLCDDGRKKENI